MWMPLKLDDVPVDPRLACALGNIIIAWTRVEQAFESDLEWLLRVVRSELRPKEIPTAFNKKLRLWHKLVRACYSEFPIYIEAAKDIRDAAKLLAFWRKEVAPFVGTSFLVS